MGIKCCKDCKDRHPHCHATCPRYLEEKMEHERQRERANKIKKTESDMFGYKEDSKRRYWKGRHER